MKYCRFPFSLVTETEDEGVPIASAALVGEYHPHIVAAFRWDSGHLPVLGTNFTLGAK